MSLPFPPGLPITKESWDRQPYQQQVQWYAHLGMTVIDPALVDNNVRHRHDDSHRRTRYHPEPNPYVQHVARIEARVMARAGRPGPDVALTRPRAQTGSDLNRLLAIANVRRHILCPGWSVYGCTLYAKGCALREYEIARGRRWEKVEVDKERGGQVDCSTTFEYNVVVALIEAKNTACGYKPVQASSRSD
ncbi:hypothetical protein CONPUDRAFT_72196 [Coniophora puteana RWD-64-598 SS2]|uniref:Uncharacterized protein n=1 Tax=Coniophora puteana (strain RWD-64-598) TaxID=741705 RepID=A0A5M3MRT7_CONPW|nr:uncharacterized protein CONPUDRAFT_72196 [Coniophora puteana RWD-64-598 SS2]EIW81810.1 hypothetical protein CONPUDRAFT_72196 [Coniophora puteana RWD-64-598 SS2]